MNIVQNVKVIDSGDWDSLVMKTYKKPYCFQQQDGCQERKNVHITIPAQAYDFEADTLNEQDNEDMGVSFASWLAKDPNKMKGKAAQYKEMFWERNFYPDLQMIANDLYEKGLIKAGDYIISIDW
jgi:hypothetical protein